MAPPEELYRLDVGRLPVLRDPVGSEAPVLPKDSSKDAKKGDDKDKKSGDKKDDKKKDDKKSDKKVTGAKDAKAKVLTGAVEP